MKQLVFTSTQNDLEHVNNFDSDEVHAVLFAPNVQTCNFLCKGIIDDNHSNDHVIKFEKSSGKCVCFLVNNGVDWYPLSDFSWAPKQNLFVYSVHRKLILFILPEK